MATREHVMAISSLRSLETKVCLPLNFRKVLFVLAVKCATTYYVCLICVSALLNKCKWQKGKKHILELSFFIETGKEKINTCSVNK